MTDKHESAKDRSKKRTPRERFEAKLAREIKNTFVSEMKLLTEEEFERFAVRVQMGRLDIDGLVGAAIAPSKPSLTKDDVAAVDVAAAETSAASA